MGWVRLDDGFAEHPKIDGLSDGAFRLWASALGYVARNLTDGFVPAGRVARLTPRFRSSHVDELLRAGAWHAAEGGYLVHDYLDWNPSASVERKRRDDARRRTQKWREARDSGPPTLPYPSGDASRDASASRDRDASPSSSRPHTCSSPPPARGDGPAGVEEEDVRLRRAAAIIAERRLARRTASKGAVVDRDAWLDACAVERLAAHRPIALAHLEDDPAMTAEQLADALEPDLRPEPSRYRERDRADDDEPARLDPDQAIARARAAREALRR